MWNDFFYSQWARANQLKLSTTTSTPNTLVLFSTPEERGKKEEKKHLQESEDLNPLCTITKTPLFREPIINLSEDVPWARMCSQTDSKT